MAAHVPPRIFRRVPFETAVRLRFDDFTGFVTEYSGNISLGGMFIRTDAPPPVGTSLEVEFKLDDDFDLIRGRGKVIWARPRAAGPELPAGMGVRFAEMTPGSRELIFQVVDRYVRQGGIPFDVEEEAAAAAKRTSFAPASRPQAPEDPFDLQAELTPAPPSPGPSAAALARAPQTPPGPPPPPEPFDLGPSPAAFPDPPLPPPVPVSMERDFAAELPGLDDVLPPRARPRAPSAHDPEREPEPDAGRDEPAPDRRERRPRRFAALAAAGLLLVVGGGALFAFRERVASWVVGTPAGAVRTAASAAGPVAPQPPAVTLPAPPAPLVPAADATGEPAPGADGTGTVAADAAGGGASAAAAEPIVAEPVAAPATAAPAAAVEPAAGPPPAAAAAATRIDKITWRQAGDATDLYLWTDGPLPADAVRHSHLGGSQPREIFRLVGIAVPFTAGDLAVGTGQVRGVRTGLHLEVSPPELHVVVDLAGPGVEMTTLDDEGGRLHIRLEGR